MVILSCIVEPCNPSQTNDKYQVEKQPNPLGVRLVQLLGSVRNLIPQYSEWHVRVSHMLVGGRIRATKLLMHAASSCHKRQIKES